MEPFTYGESYNRHKNFVNIPLGEEFYKRTGPTLQAVGDVFKLTERNVALFVLVLENAGDEAVSIQQVIKPHGDFGLNEKNLNVRAYDIYI